jgi:hypothetical protein
MRRYLIGLCGLGLLVLGCGEPANRPLTQDDEGKIALSDVGELYRVFTAQKKKPPTKLADFLPMEPKSPMGVLALQSGVVIVRFGATLPDTEEGSTKGPDEVLAFEKKAPESDGQVLMLNRTIRTMTLDEFMAAKLSGTESSSAVPSKGKAKGR